MAKPKLYRLRVTLKSGLSYCLRSLSKNPKNLDEFVAVTEGGENLTFARDDLASHNITEIERKGD